MGWLETYDDSNKVVDSVSARVERYKFYTGAALKKFRRVATETKYRYVSMTLAAAESAVVALLSAAPEGTTRTATTTRQNDGDAYQVNVSDFVEGTWEVYT